MSPTRYKEPVTKITSPGRANSRAASSAFSGEDSTDRRGQRWEDRSRTVSGAAERNCSFYDAIQFFGEQKKLILFKQWFDRMKTEVQESNRGLVELLREVLEGSGMVRHWMELASTEAEERLANLNELVAAVKAHKPDLLFFSGDQIYEGDLTSAQREPLEKALLDYLDKWYRWCWAFRDLARAIPCICIPDDHDVYHGNLWGAGGRHAVTADDGGYIMDPLFVNMVQETQTSHLPDPYDPTPVEQGIGVYYTALNYGGISFAILEDRKWKSSPTVAVPEGKFVNGWPQNPEFDAVTESDVPDAELLGSRQIEFLHQWSQDWWHETWFKVALSQTLFANVATLPRGATLDSVLPQTPFILPDVYPTDWNLAVDADSNGWPQRARNQALYELRRGLALHVSGDQHLGSTVQYGIDGWRDAGYSLCVPSIANTWPRRWYPPQPGKNWKAGDPPYTGNFLDGFGNHMTVFAVSGVMFFAWRASSTPST